MVDVAKQKPLRTRGQLFAAGSVCHDYAGQSRAAVISRRVVSRRARRASTSE